MNDIQTHVATHVDWIVRQHVNGCDHMLGQALVEAGLWDGHETTKRLAAERFAHRLARHSYQGPEGLVDRIALDGHVLCSVITTIEPCRAHGLHVFTRVLDTR